MLDLVGDQWRRPASRAARCHATESQANSSFELGVDAKVAVFNNGSGDTLTTITTNNPIVFYAVENTGLLADISMKGGRFTKLDRQQCRSTPARAGRTGECFTDEACRNRWESG